MIRPRTLQSGDLIALVSPAKSIEIQTVQSAKDYLVSKGYRVVIGTHSLDQHFYFSGTDEQRTADFQWAIDHPDIAAIICNRGGYGALRIVERINWANLLREPKWMIGFSDITNFHCKALQLGVESVHATMPLNYSENSPQALDSFLEVLKTGSISHQWNGNEFNRTGTAEGILIGGNLSILYSLLGTPLCPNFEGAILFIEDVGEQLYHIDRMLHAFALAGVFDQIKGLIVGGMTDMKDTPSGIGYTLEQLVSDQFLFRSKPIVFNAPIGHVADNRAVICGRNAILKVDLDSCQLIQD